MWVLGEIQTILIHIWPKYWQLWKKYDKFSFSQVHALVFYSKINLHILCQENDSVHAYAVEENRHLLVMSAILQHSSWLSLVS